ncbi:MAG: proline dehydrogenase family protein [Propionibacteriaceae bacterium]|nr:proline dehydrogenase family protein [Propionibacteriaceae bacterium]
MYRAFFLTLARTEAFRKLLVTVPGTRQAVSRFVAGDSWETARDQVADLVDKGLKASVDFLSRDVTSTENAQTIVETYTHILDMIHEQGWAHDVDVSIRLISLGLLLHDGERLAASNVRVLADKAREVGTRITLDMEGLATTAKTLRVVQALREQYPEVGFVLQANLKRTESDCRALDAPTSRVRLCKGSYTAPSQVAFSDKHDVDLSYVRCLKVLMEGEGTPLVATHDPVMIEIAQELAAHSNRGLKDFEFQMLYGVRPVEQERLVDLGHVVRVYVPFGEQWYGYITRRLAESPANLFSFLRALAGLR